MNSRACVECARFNRFTWLEDDGTCRRASEHGMTAAERLAARDAGLGVGHIWTAVSCPAYRTLNGADCTCNLPRCVDCGRPCKPGGFATGYAITPTGEKVCYPCADARQREELRTAERFTAYLSADYRTVTTWTGGRLGTVTRCTDSRRAQKTYVRVTDVHGAHWFGVGPLESGTYVSLRRAKS